MDTQDKSTQALYAWGFCLGKAKAKLTIARADRTSPDNDDTLAAELRLHIWGDTCDGFFTRESFFGNDPCKELKQACADALLEILASGESLEESIEDTVRRAMRDGARQVVEEAGWRYAVGTDDSKVHLELLKSRVRAHARQEAIVAAMNAMGRGSTYRAPDAALGQERKERLWGSACNKAFAELLRYYQRHNSIWSRFWDAISKVKRLSPDKEIRNDLLEAYNEGSREGMYDAIETFDWRKNEQRKRA